MASNKTAQKTLSLAPVLDLNEATALHEKLVALKGSDIVIDASAVERVGTLCVQVLMAGAKILDALKYERAAKEATEAAEA